MASKEALKELCKGCEYSLSLAKTHCPFRSISNDYCDEYNDLLKDLEVLEQYKTIEKELGIGLITLFKALKNGFYYMSDDEVLFADNYNEEIGIEYYKGHNYCDYGITWAGVGVAYTKDYGKTWALTKEELE